MSELMRVRSPLETFLRQNIRGNQRDDPDRIPGLIIDERKNTCQLQMIARNNDADQLSNILVQYLGLEKPLTPMAATSKNGLLICATGPLEYWVMAQQPGSIDALAAIQSEVEQSASIFDQSEGKLVLGLTGAKVVDVLAKGTALDLHAKALPAQGAAHTVIEHIPVLLTWQSDAGHYNLVIPRSYAHSFLNWLCDAARDVGYVINKDGNEMKTAPHKNG